MVTWGTSPRTFADHRPRPTQGVPDEARRAGVIRSLEYMGLTPGTPLADIAIDHVFIGSCTNGRIEVARGRLHRPGA